MFKKDRKWVEELVSGQNETDVNQIRYLITSKIIEYLNNHREKCHNEKPTPTLRPAWQARIISEHGINSRDWKEYNEQIDIVTKQIDSICRGAFAENHMIWYEQANGELNEHTIKTLEKLGYIIVDYCADCKKIVW